MRNRFILLCIATLLSGCVTPAPAPPSVAIGRYTIDLSESMLKQVHRGPMELEVGPCPFVRLNYQSPTELLIAAEIMPIGAKAFVSVTTAGSDDETRVYVWRAGTNTVIEVHAPAGTTSWIIGQDGQLRPNKPTGGDVQ